MNQSGNNTRRGQGRNNISKRRIFFIILALIVAVLVVIVIITSNRADHASTDSATMRSANNDSSSKATEPAPTEPSATGVVITTGDSEFGTILFNEKKQAIYIWERERSEKPECYGDCAEAWPPVLTNGKPQAAGSLNSNLLGTTMRTDGSIQVTYNGHPLYYYAHEGPGEVKCHNISTHGGLWWVIQPSGNRAA